MNLAVVRDEGIAAGAERRLATQFSEDAPNCISCQWLMFVRGK